MLKVLKKGIDLRIVWDVALKLMRIHQLMICLKKQDLHDYLNRKTEDWVLSSNPVSEELIPYVRLNIKSKRLRKKFLKNPMFYRKRLKKKIVSEYMSKLLGNSFSNFIMATLERESFARRVLLVETIAV
jgi:hypothetical protein